MGKWSLSVVRPAPKGDESRADDQRLERLLRIERQTMEVIEHNKVEPRSERR
jgi:hypothetical protein